MTRQTFASVSGMPYGKTPEEHRAYMRWWRSMNREDYNKKRLEWSKAHKDRRHTQARRSYLKKKFDITIEECAALSAKQDHLCAICGDPGKGWTDIVGRERPSLLLDHDHTTGKIRGLLCHQCNVAIGHFNDNLDIMHKAIRYIESFS